MQQAALPTPARCRCHPLNFIHLFSTRAPCHPLLKQATPVADLQSAPSTFSLPSNLRAQQQRPVREDSLPATRTAAAVAGPDEQETPLAAPLPPPAFVNALAARMATSKRVEPAPRAAKQEGKSQRGQGPAAKEGRGAPGKGLSGSQPRPPPLDTAAAQQWLSRAWERVVASAQQSSLGWLIRLFTGSRN